MREGLKLSDGLIENLSDEELNMIIEVIPPEILLNFIKSHHNEFKEDTRGCQLVLGSKLLMERLPKIYLKRLKKRDLGVIKFIEFHINHFIKIINNHIYKSTSDEDFLNKALLDEDIGVFEKLLDIISEILQPKFFKLYFRLLGHDLTNAQNVTIDVYIKTVRIKKQLTEQLTEQLTKQLTEQLTDQIQAKLEEEYQKEIVKYKKKIDEYEKEIAEYKRKISECETREEKLKNELQCAKAELANEKEKLKKIKDAKKDVEIKNSKEINKLRKQIEELKRNIEYQEAEISTLNATIDQKQAHIENLCNLLSQQHDEYYKKIQEEWNAKNTELISTIERLSEECTKLNEAKKQLTIDIQSLEVDKQSLEIEKTQLESKISEYRNIMDNFIENIDRYLIEKGLYDSLERYKANIIKTYLHFEAQSANNLYIIKNKVLEPIEKCLHINDFAENLAINLENIGITDRADGMANYIIGILATGLVPLVCGFRAREIAYAISISYSGETPFVVSLPNGYTNSKQIFEIFKKAKSNVILIEDAVGTMNENSLLPLLRENSIHNFSPKLLLLSTENVDSVRYMPASMYNYVALVTADKYSLKKTQYNPGNAIEIFQKFVLNENIDDEYKLIKRKLSKLLNNIDLGNPYEILRTSIIAYSSKFSNVSSALKEYLKSELLFICKYNDFLEKLEENIEEYDHDDNLIEVVRGG